MLPPQAPSPAALPRAFEDRRIKLAGLLITAGGFGAILFALSALADKWSLGFQYVLPLVALAIIASNVCAAGILLLAVGCGRGRALRDRRRWRAAMLQVLLVNALAIAFLAGALMDDKSLKAYFAESGWDFVLAVTAYLCGFVAWRLWRRSRQHESISADEAMSLDPRPPVLYLRSFQDDGLSLIASEGGGFMRRLYQSVSLPTPEEHMANILSRVGPLIAIGKPGEPLPELGAARLYVTHDQWQQKVIDLMQRASLVVIRVGASPGVLWEIDQALSRLPRQRLVIAVLGGSAVAPELISRLQPVVGASLTTALPEPVPGWRLLVQPRASRRIGGLVCFDANANACAVPVRMGFVRVAHIWAWRRYFTLSAPLEFAWEAVFERLGLAWGDPSKKRSRAVAALLALLFGWVGAHWFYLGNKKRGWKYLAMLPLAAIMMIVSWADAIRFIWADRAEFEARFLDTAESQQPQANRNS